MQKQKNNFSFIKNIKIFYFNLFLLLIIYFFYYLFFMNYLFTNDKPIHTGNINGITNLNLLQRNVENIITTQNELNQHITKYSNVNYNDFQMQKMFDNISLNHNIQQQTSNFSHTNTITQNINKNNNELSNNYNTQFNYSFQPSTIHSSLVNFNELLKKEEEINTTQQQKEKKETLNEIEKPPIQEIIDKMESHSDPRMKSSSFLSFMKSLNSNEISLNEEENTINKKEKVIDNNQEKMSKLWNNISSNIDSIPNNVFTINELNINNESIPILYEQAKKDLDNNRDDLCIEKINSIISKEPNYYKAYLLQCLYFYNEGSDKDAIKSSLLFIKNNPKLSSLYSKNVSNNINLNIDFVDSSLDPDKIDYNNHLSYSTYELNKNNIYNSIISFLSSSEIEQDNEILTLLGLLYMGQNNQIKAEEILKKIISINPEDYNGYNRLGAFYANHKQYNKAIKAYEEALKLKNDYPRCLVNMGISLMSIEDYKNSARYFINALKINKDMDETWNYLFGVFLAMERNDLCNKVSTRNIDEIII